MKSGELPYGDDVLGRALAEDIRDGDVTCRFFVEPTLQGEARIFAKEPAVLAGAEIAAEAFRRVDPSLAVRVGRADGDSLSIGETVLEIKGAAGSILTAERTALNFVQQLSGVATLTRRFADAVAGTRARILDTRKTVPGLRELQKAAVKAGGGVNHRMGLFDMAMVKDNHLAAHAGVDFLRDAIARLKAARPETRVELEADTIEQVRAFLALENVDVIMLDNMDCVQMREAVKLGRQHGGRVEFEASGGVKLETVRAIAETGVDFISIGALTHSARAVDFSLELHHA